MLKYFNFDFSKFQQHFWNLKSPQLFASADLFVEVEKRTENTILILLNFNSTKITIVFIIQLKR